MTTIPGVVARLDDPNPKNALIVPNPAGPPPTKDCNDDEPGGEDDCDDVDAATAAAVTPLVGDDPDATPTN